MATVAVIMTTQTQTGKTILQQLSHRGCTVLEGTAAATAPIIDLLIVNPETAASDLTHTPADFADLQQTYERYALGALRFVEACMPAMGAGRKRICFVIESTSRAEGATSLGEAMAKAALHMACKILFNDLHRDGYTFRFLVLEAPEEDRLKIACAHFLEDADDEDACPPFNDADRKWA